MARLSLTERIRVGLLLADRSRRRTAARILSSRVLQWRYGPPTADQLIILPRDLRTADPSFWSEISTGHFGLAGAVASTQGGSAFDLAPPTAAWARELHGFSWLRHLDAANAPEAKAAAVEFVLEWVGRNRARKGVAWEPAVVGRRLISWISHASLLLEGAPPRSYDRIAESLGRQVVHLSAAWRQAPSGHQRLLALTAVVLADLCIAGHEAQLETFEAALSAEIDRQILPDGGHVSRNPGVLVELLLDFLPLSQCFKSRGRPPPRSLLAAIDRMLPMLRFMRLGDGALARFNGMGVPSPDALATVLAYGGDPIEWDTIAPDTRYARLEAGDTVVVVDVGAPPPLDLAGQAHAGCLAFEMSFGKQALLLNGGAPGPADDDWRAASRATSSHNALCLADRSSARLIRNRMLEQLIGAPPIRFPAHVHARADESRLKLTARHDGYLADHGLLHTRTLSLDPSGRQLSGLDQLGPPSGALRLAYDVPFAVHFHLDPEARCTLLSGSGAVEIELGSQKWIFALEGAVPRIEDSIYYADFSGPRQTKQIVLRGTSHGESEIRWSITDANRQPSTATTRVSSEPEASASPPALVRALPPPLPPPLSMPPPQGQPPPLAPRHEPPDDDMAKLKPPPLPKPDEPVS